jgi:hypothetical protein
MHYKRKSVLSVKLNIHLIFNWQLNTNSTTPLRNLKHGNDVMISAFCSRAMEHTHGNVVAAKREIFLCAFACVSKNSECERERTISSNGLK